MQRRVEKETVRGLDMEIAWQGCNVAEMLPPGQPLRLYQRRLGVPKVIPDQPEPSEEIARLDARPTE